MAMTCMENNCFEFRGVNHFAIMARDMNDTVKFYSEILGMKLVCDVRGGNSHHFFLEVGNGIDVLAWLSFDTVTDSNGLFNAQLPEDQPGIARSDLFDGGSGRSAVGSLNHICFDVPAEKLSEYRALLVSKNVECTGIQDEGECRKIFYFQDPNNLVLAMGSYYNDF